MVRRRLEWIIIKNGGGARKKKKLLKERLAEDRAREARESQTRYYDTIIAGFALGGVM